MQPPRVIVVIPTLSADYALWECVESLQRQRFTDFRIVIVDNSGCRRTETEWPEHVSRSQVTVLHPESNIGFGAAVNLGAREAASDYVAVINDDATADGAWLGEMVAAMDRFPEAGSGAAQVQLHGLDNRLDSAGMLIAADGTSKQRGHSEPAETFGAEEEVLLPSGSASIYRRTMLAETGGFDDSFFLYCEDTDLGLRARWAGWTCRYVPAAIVRHRYSHSAGRASRLKAYYVERNRLLLIVKTFPFPELAAAPFATILRYLYHWQAMRRGQGAAAQFGEGIGVLIGCIIKAHLSALLRLPSLMRQRRTIRRSARLSTESFRALLARHAISLRQVAAQ